MSKLPFDKLEQVDKEDPKPKKNAFEGGHAWFWDDDIDDELDDAWAARVSVQRGLLKVDKSDKAANSTKN